MEQQNEETKIMGIKRETIVLAIAIAGSVFASVALLMPQFNSIEGNFNRMDGSIKELNDALLQTNATNAELAVKSATHNAEIRALSADVATNGAAIADLNNKVGDGEVRLGSIEQRLSDVDEMDDRLDDLEQVKMKNFANTPCVSFGRHRPGVATEKEPGMQTTHHPTIPSQRSRRPKASGSNRCARRCIILGVSLKEADDS